MHLNIVHNVEMNKLNTVTQDVYKKKLRKNTFQTLVRENLTQ